MTNSAFWSQLANRFRDIPDTSGTMGADWNSVGWPNGMQWDLTGGPGETERELFKSVADLGAIALGYPPSPNNYINWLDHLMPEAPGVPMIGKGRRTNGEVSYELRLLQGVSETSARYCMKLESEAFIDEIRKSANSPRKRGRPPIDPQKKQRALEVKKGGGSNQDAARILYDTPYPTIPQVKNVPAILKYFAQTSKMKESDFLGT